MSVPPPAPGNKALAIDPVAAARIRLLKSFIIPAALLVFFIFAPAWLNFRLHSSLENQVNASARWSEPQKEQIIAHYKAIDFGDVAFGRVPAEAGLRASFDAGGATANFRRLRWGLYFSIALNALLLAAAAGVWQLNQWARRSSADLIRGYLWGWRLAMAAVFVKVFLLVPLLAYGIYELTTLLFERIFPQLILGIVLGGLLALWRSAAILLKPVPLEFAEPMARDVTPEQAPKLWQVVREAARTLKTEPPDHIVVGMQFNFYVTELSVRHNAGRTQGRTLFLSHPGLQQLPVEQVVAIIGHELGHFVGEDTKITREFYPLRHKVNGTMAALARAGWVGATGLQFLSFFNLSFARTEQAMSRQRELLADRRAADLTSPATMAQALVRFQVLAEAYRLGITDALRNRTAHAIDLPFQAVIREKLLPRHEFWSELFQKRAPHPLDSHPALQVRLESLNQAVSGAEAMALVVGETPSAYAAWFPADGTLFAEVAEQADQALRRISGRTQLQEASYDTPEGKQLLDRSFPPIAWPGSSKSFGWEIGFLAALGGSVFVLVLVFGKAVDSVGLTLLAIGAAAWIGFCALLWFRHRNGNLVLTAEQLNYTGWNRPLRWAEVESMVVIKQYGRVIGIRFRLKQPAASIWRGGLIGLKRKGVVLRLKWFRGKNAQIAETIFRYLTRQTPA